LTDGINVIELFAGAGGLAQGFIKNEGFNLLALTDIDYNAGETFKKNYSSVYYEVTDICNLAPKSFHTKFGKEKVHGLIGGPPCQGFSSAGKREIDDKRNLLALEYLKFVDFLRPDFVVLENVPQFLHHKIYKDIFEYLKTKYYLASGVLNSALYGTPQTRLRAVIIGFRKKTKIKPTLPLPTHAPINPIFGYRTKQLVDPNVYFSEILGINATIKLDKIFGSNIEQKIYKPFVTVEDAIGDLPSINSGESADIYLTQPTSDYQRKSRKEVNILHNHISRKHDDNILNLFENLPEGGDLKDLDIRFHPANHFSQAYSRLHRLGLARTITNSFQNPGSGRFTHYRDNRTLTVREAARLQGFSDDFVFVGAQTEQLKYVGNAVPIPLAEAIANHIYGLLKPFYG
jgi:DNA (cytosine-5)-methyltransferase 1